MEVLSALILAAALPATAWAAPINAASAAGAPSRSTCEHRSNDSTAKLLACIRQPWLWNHLVDFQNISDQNPDARGHGNRNTGSNGYKASVDYVANLMRQAGYVVTLQPYHFQATALNGTPQFQSVGHRYAWNRDWFVAHLSAGGTLAAPLQVLAGAGSGCNPEEFSRFTAGNIALLQRGNCRYDVQVGNAAAAGASAVILYNQPDHSFVSDFLRTIGSPGPEDGSAFEARLTHAAPIPVIGVVSNAVGSGLRQQADQGRAPVVQLDIPTTTVAGTDYNLIAESPYGNSDQTVVVDAHLDAIYGAGILDNASGSATILEVALKMSHTPTRNRLRYIWFGGEELGLLGSSYYTKHLTAAEKKKLVFDVDVDVTATPNYDYLVADPSHAPNVKRFTPSVVPNSQIGNQYFADYFASVNVLAQNAWFGNEGTDSNSFALIGIPDTGILTMQDCCKQHWEVKIWGGFTGNYEGKVPGSNGGCVDNPNRWCDNLGNNDPAVMFIASKATAYTIFQLANHSFTTGNP